jgi:hypothetical protein
MEFVYIAGGEKTTDDRTLDQQESGCGCPGKRPVEDSYRQRVYPAVHVRLCCRERLETGISAAVEGRGGWQVVCKGRSDAINAPRRLEYTIIDPNSTIADIPSNYLKMTYELTERGDHASTLEIIQGDFATVENGQQRYEDSLGGGDFILPDIKKLAEEQAKAAPSQ